MNATSENQVTCPHCGKQYAKSDLRRHCSNCFACTGCERYLCAGCDEVIEVIPVKPPSFKKNSMEQH